MINYIWEAVVYKHGWHSCPELVNKETKKPMFVCGSCFRDIYYEQERGSLIRKSRRIEQAIAIGDYECSRCRGLIYWRKIPNSGKNKTLGRAIDLT